MYEVNMVLGFDFGFKYIGVASGQSITNTAAPLCSLSAKDGIPNWDEIEQLIKDWQPDQLLVGMPFNMDGSIQEISHCAKKFSNRLKERFKLPVCLVDERLSTWEAKNQLRLFESSKKSKKQLQDLNAQAAVVIVEQWLRDRET